MANTANNPETAPIQQTNSPYCHGIHYNSKVTISTLPITAALEHPDSAGPTPLLERATGTSTW